MKYINTDKLKRIKLKKDNFFIIIDFDKTITAKESCDSWDASCKKLGKEFLEEMYNLYDKYSPIELSYDISFEEKNRAMEEWYNNCMNLFYKYKIEKKDLEESIKSSKIIFREGGRELLDCLNQNNIPVIILSAGIGNVIEQFLKDENCYYDNIYIISNIIPFDEDGNLMEFQGRVIHTLNKTMKGRVSKEFSEKIANRKYRLLIGDFVEDKKMVPMDEWERTISIRFLR